MEGINSVASTLSLLGDVDVDDRWMSLDCASDHGCGYCFHDSLYVVASEFGVISMIITVYDVCSMFRIYVRKEMN